MSILSLKYASAVSLLIVLVSLHIIVLANHRMYGGFVSDDYYPTGFDEIYFTDDAMNTIASRLDTYGCYDTLVGPAWKDYFVEESDGGNNVISDYDLVFYGGHGASCIIDTYDFNNGNKPSSIELNFLEPRRRLKWILLLSCSSTNCGIDVFRDLFNATQQDQLTSTTVLHGIIGFKSAFYDNHEVCDLFGCSYPWNMDDDFALPFSTKLLQSRNIITSWRMAAQNALYNLKQYDNSIQYFKIKYGYSYVEVEVAIYLDRHAPPIYELIVFDYSKEKIPLLCSDRFYPTPGSIADIARYIKEQFGAYKVVVLSYTGELKISEEVIQ